MAQLTMFDVPAPTTDTPRGPGRMAEREHAQLIRIHGGGPQKCGACAHLVNHSHARNYYKCRNASISGGPATDWRLNWAACGLFTRRDAKHEPAPLAGPTPRGVAATSVAAYERIAPTLSAKRAEVLAAITARGAHGLTIDEHSAATGKPANEFSGRFSELAAAGRIEATGAFRRTRRGASARAWRAVL